jgi:hypothetical protein
MSLEGTDRTGDILKPSFELGDLLTGAIFVERTGLRALVRLLPQLLQGQPILSRATLLLLEQFLGARLSRGHFSERLAQFVDLILERGDTRFVAPSVILLPIERLCGRGLGTAAHSSS